MQIVELSESVRKAAPFFAHINYDVLNQPNVRVRVDDGRNFLLLSGETFDVITADIIQPIHAGAGNLYSREYFTLVRERAQRQRPRAAVDWPSRRRRSTSSSCARSSMSSRTRRSGSTAISWWVPSSRFDSIRHASAPSARHRRPRAALDDIGLTSFDVLANWYTAGPDAMRRFVGPGPLLTDDRPLVEYHRSLPQDAGPLDLSTLRSDFSEVVGLVR